MKDNLFRTVFFYVLLITMGTGQIWAYDPHFYLTGKTPTGSWSNSATAWFLVSPASDSYDQYCTYVWLSENDYFGLNNGKNRYSRCDNNDQEIKDGYGSGQFSILVLPAWCELMYRKRMTTAGIQSIAVNIIHGYGLMKD